MKKQEKKKEKEFSAPVAIAPLSKMELGNKPTLIITKKLKRQIDFLHKKQGASEWSGELITTEKGTINDLDKWVITAEEIFLADLGSPSFTGYEVDKGGFKSVDIVEMYETYPGLLEGTHKNHHIHSHHKMGCFFSATDWSQLHDRSLVSNYFLMLIVNIAGDAIAKVAFKAKKEAKTPVKLCFSNNSDGFTPLSLTGDDDKEVLVVMNCKVELEEEEISVDELFATRYESVVKAIAEEKRIQQEELKKKQNKYKHSNQDNPYGAPGSVKQGRFYYDEEPKENWYLDEETGEWINSKAPKKPSGNGKQYYHKLTNDWRPYPEITHRLLPTTGGFSKKISEMTDKEFQDFENGSVTPEKWDLRHAKIMLNCSLRDSVHQDTTDCRDLLLETSKQLELKDKKKEEFLEDFGLNLIESYQLMFPGKSAEKDAYYDLLEKMIEYLSPYNYISIVDDIILEIKMEMDEIRADIYRDMSLSLQTM